MLRREGTCTRDEVAKSTDLTPASVTRIVTELIECGLVVEDAYEGKIQGAGRRPSALRVNQGRLYVAGVHIGVNYFDIGLFDLEANLITRLRPPHPHGQGAEDSLEFVATTIEGLIEKSGLARPDLAAVGVGTGGWVDPDKGIVRLHPQLGWRDVPVQAILEARLRTVSVVENMVNSMALAETRYGAGLGVDNLVLIMVGNVLGAGIIIGGRIYSGSEHMSGQLGHIVVNQKGPVCSCGNRGCLDALAADSVLIGRAAGLLDLDPESLTIETVMETAEREAGEVRRAVRQRARLIGRMAATAINLYNPSLVVLAGSVVLAPEVQLPSLTDSVRKHMFPPSRETVRVALSSFGDRAGLVGAAALPLELVYSPRLDVVNGVNGHLKPVLAGEGGAGDVFTVEQWS